MQIGVTVATMLSSAVGAATISGEVAAWLVELGMAAGVADPLALVGITLIISFLSLVLGELAPKRLGLQRSECIALARVRPAGRAGPAVPAGRLAAGPLHRPGRPAAAR